MGLGRGFESQQSNGCAMKRTLEEQGEADVEAEPKRACKEGANSEMEEFFALLERIAAMEKLQRNERAANEQKKSAKNESLWRPAFVWEDFCTDANGNGTRDVEPKPDDQHRKEEILHETKNDDNNKNGHDFLNHGRRSPSSDPNDEDCGIQRLDLNLPSSGMEYFF